MIGRLICALTKHKRGKPVAGHPNTFRCPRCGRWTQYKARAPIAQTSPTDGSEHFTTLAESTKDYLNKEREKLK